MARTKSQTGGETNGYNKPSLRTFTLPPRCGVLDVPPRHHLSRRAELTGELGFRLLRDPDGRPVCKARPDLRPGEVSLVLE